MPTRTSTRTPRLSERDIANLPTRPSQPELEQPSEPPASAPAAPAMLTAVGGVVVEERSGIPLAGVTVKWGLAGNARKTDGAAFRELGAAVTDREGRFRIELGGDPGSRDAVCLARGGRQGEDVVSLADERGRLVGRPVKVSAETREIVLHPAPEKPAERQYRALGAWLATNRKVMVRDLAGQLASPDRDSPVAEWPAPARASVLRELTQALANEDRRTGEALDLLYRNDFVETTVLEAGNVRRAVTVLNDPKRIGDLLPLPGHSFPWLQQSDLSLYRDYLRGVWVAAAQRMYQEATFSTPSVAVLERQLDERFEQDFHVMDDSPEPAAQLLVPLLTRILLRSAARGGIGLTAAAVPARGAQSDEEYLATLIAASKLSPRELRNRFRVTLVRPSGETTSLLQLNVEALLGLLADTYQSPQEPFDAVPPANGQGKPLIFGPYIGRAPFFLEYEEWLDRQRGFYPENIYDIRRSIPDFNADYRTSIAGQKAMKGPPRWEGGQDYFADYPDEKAASAGWIETLFAIADRIREGLEKLDQQLYADALRKFDEADGLLWAAAKAYDSRWFRDKFWWWWSIGKWNLDNEAGKLYPDTRVSLLDRAKLKVTTPEQLASFEKFFDPPYYPVWTGQIDNGDEAREKSVAKARTLYIYDVFYLQLVLLPYLRSTVYFALGDYARAIHLLALLTGYPVGIAETTSAAGYDPNGPRPAFPNLYRETTLPYTTLVGFDDGAYTDLSPTFHEYQPGPPGSYQRLALAPFEQRFFKLAQGEAMLALADTLYRNDDPSSIRRARELYKGVLFMHGEDPDIAPHFPRGGPWMPPQGTDPLWKLRENPAKVSQTTRAWKAFYQIEQGLNAYGYRDDMVPVLRYKPLKQAADLFAASAKSAQTDFLTYTTRYEQALIDLWHTRSLVKKAEASGGIATEHEAIAQVGVDKAKEQVAAVQAQIAAKQQEIADKDSIFEQFKDYLGGAKDAITGMVPLAQKAMAEDSAAGAVTGDQMLGIAKAGFSGGASGAENAAVSTLGSGMGLMVGFGTFVYASYTSMEAMEEAANKRGGELKALQDVALPAAQAQVRLRERDVAIARYESQIAAADLEFASTLLRFQQDRFLNADFWNKLTLFANRLMRRYVDLGARTAWMAERALAFEQGRRIQIIRLNYLPAALRGVTGADRLQADLAELEATRIQGIRLATPVKHTISLARDFPLAFGQLVKTGRCRFHTFEAALRRAYPGTYAYRVRALTVAPAASEGPPPRGILRNQGVSLVSDEQLATRVLLRFPDALALSEFRLRDDLFTYGLPGETLMQFEGSGYETDWQLEFPVAANAKGLRPLADVLITFDMLAYHSEAAAAAQAAGAAPGVSRAVMLPASALDPKGLHSLVGAADPVRITFDPGKLQLPRQESGRQVTNLALVLVGRTTKPLTARLTAGKPAKTVAFQISDGIALSNAGPLQGTAAPLPLNGLAGKDVDQPFTLEIDRAGAGDELKALYDVVLYLEYQAVL
jgi:hypothetical protein